MRRDGTVWIVAAVGICAAAQLGLGCSAEEDGGRLRGSGADNAADRGGEGEAAGSVPAGVACTPTGRSYPGWDEGVTLEGDRVAGFSGGERERIKPYQALTGELERVLGGPVALAKGAFGEEPANADAFENHYHDNMALDGNGQPKRTPTNVSTWFTEAKSGALELYSIVEAANAGCAAYVAKSAAMAQAPTPESAGAACAEMERAFWSRTPTPAEIEPCVKAATDGAADESDPRRKWAWGCTAAITSAGFLAY